MHMCTQSHLLVELNILSQSALLLSKYVCDGSISSCWEHFPPEEVSFDQQQQHTRCWNIFSVWWWVVLTRLKPPLNIFLSDRLSHNLDGGWRRRVIKRRWRWALSSPPAFPFHPCPVILCFVGNINWFLILGFSGSPPPAFPFSFRRLGCCVLFGCQWHNMIDPTDRHKGVSELCKSLLV